MRIRHGWSDEEETVTLLMCAHAFTRMQAHSHTATQIEFVHVSLKVIKAQAPKKRTNERKQEATAAAREQKIHFKDTSAVQ